MIRIKKFKFTKPKELDEMKRTLWKRILGILLAGVMSMLAAGCASSSQSASSEQAANTTLRIGAQPYPLYIPVYVAKELGYLDEELQAVGASYEWDEFQSGPLVNEAAAAGEIDMGFMADLPAIIAKSSGQDIEVVSNVAYGEKGLAVLVSPNSNISSVADLKGKKVAYATGSYAQHLLALLLSKEGLSLDDVQSVNLGAGDSPAALESGEVDAIVIWEQYISQLTSEGKAKVLADGTGVKRGNMVTYFTTDYAKQHPDVVKAYIKALNRADEQLKKDPDGCAKAIVSDFGIDETLMKQIIGNFTYLTALTPDDIAEITAVKDFSLQSGIIQSDVDMNSFINTTYVDEVNQTNGNG